MPPDPSPPQPPPDHIRLQFEYAWKWFKYHADQRVKMFNFMLLAFGVLATALFTALSVSRVGAVVLCLVAALLAVIFALLDGRNRNLTWLGEDVLASLEPAIFGDSRSIACIHAQKGEVRLGLLTRPQWEKSRLGFGDLTKHRFLLPATAWLICAFFIGTAIAIATGAIRR
jgi:hypothetical protein